MGVRPEAASAPEGGGGDAHKQFTYKWSNYNKQRYSGGLLQAHHLEMSDAVLQRLRSGDLMAGPNGVTQTQDRHGAGEEGQKRRRAPSMSPPRVSRRSGGDYNLGRGSRHPSCEEESYRRGSRHTPQPMGGLKDGHYDYHPPTRGEHPRQLPQRLPRNDGWGQDHRLYDAHRGYGERFRYPRPEAYPMVQVHQGPGASPPAASYRGARPMEVRYPEDGRAPQYGGIMPQQGAGFPQTLYQHQPYAPPNLTTDAAANPSGYAGPL